MENDYKKYISPICIVVVLIYVLCCIIKKPAELGDYTSYAGYAATVVTVFSIIYVKWIWKWKIWRIIGFEELPVLHSKYVGKIKYNFIEPGEKNITLKISQNLLSIKIKMVTDINRSYTITSKIIKQNDIYYLYYTYQTHPQSMVRDCNPQQYGSTQIIIEDSDNLQGIYWTTQKTTGDIFLHKA